ncbi:hypothetical protein BJ741DRAFT_603112 [Chytriomyces cf. hyalinus JEL632]|nr:hypothetical protein BJ741DRAFT_603112 [Chytriomyces cf. hyalinus JEL632]
MLPGTNSYKSNKHSCMRWFRRTAVRTEDAHETSQLLKGESTTTLHADETQRGHRTNVFAISLRNTLIHSHDDEDTETDSRKLEASGRSSKGRVFNKLVFSGTVPQHSAAGSSKREGRAALKNDLVYSETDSCAPARESGSGSSLALKNSLIC